MISDVMFDASSEVRRYQREFTAYEGCEQELDNVVLVMESLGLLVGAPPSTVKDHQKALGELRDALRGLDLTALNAARERLQAVAVS